MVVEERHRNIEAGSGSHPQVRLDQAKEMYQSHKRDGYDLDDLMPILAESTAALRKACRISLERCSRWLDEVNHSRWTKRKSTSSLAERETSIAALKEELEGYRAKGQFAMMDRFRDHFDTNGNITAAGQADVRYTARDMFMCNVFTSNLVAFALSVIEFQEMLLEMERKAPKAKIQLPGAFAKMLLKTANDKQVSNPLEIGTGPEDHSTGGESQDTLVDEKDEKGSKKDKKARTYCMSSCSRCGCWS